MELRKIFAAREYSAIGDLALLVIRFVAGLAFVLHGWSKIQQPFTWMGADSSVPAVFQGLAALSEFGGGLAWILGLLTPLASLGIVSTMTVAVWFHAIQRGDPFVSKTGGPAFELAAIYFGIALVFIALGPGRFSLDRLLFGRR